MGLYKKEDLVKVTYEEFGRTMEVLLSKIRDYQKKSGITFNLVVPLLRSGAFPAFHLAANLEIKNILPVYFMYQNGKIIKRLEIPKILTPLSDNLNILICDSCLVSGNTVSTALAEIKTLFPDAKYFVSAVWLEEGINSINGVEEIFYGRRTNEKGAGTSEDCINGLVVAPWEDFEVDWKEIKDY